MNFDDLTEREKVVLRMALGKVAEQPQPRLNLGDFSNTRGWERDIARDLLWRVR